ncbi:MAG: hypothetical protein IKM72_15925 [Oscillospiraceae bacterium]|nr:hypothetical protein [Oscillospiraceae bacterium]
MACFLVPTAEAIVTTVASAVIKKSKINEKKTDEYEVRFSDRLGRLNGLLWGGSGLLAFEHLWHGEISPFFPVLTAASNPESTQVMLDEMAVNGTAMAVIVTAVWAATVVFEKIWTKNAKEHNEKEVRS